MTTRLAFIGFTFFMIGIGIYLLQPGRFLGSFTPVFTIGGVCMIAIATILSMKKSR